MRRLITLLAVLTLAAPLMFLGCSGDDGSTGAAGPPGVPGDPGPPGPGVVTEETCTLCHGSGKAEAVAGVHRIGETAGTATATITSVLFGAPGVDNVPVTVTFTFTAFNSDNVNITPSIDLRTASAGALSYVRVSMAQLAAGTNGNADTWGGFVMRPGERGSGPYYANASAGMTGTPATGVYSYALPDNAVRVSDGYLDNVVTRVAIQISGLPTTLFTSDPYFSTSLRRPVVNSVLDVVNPIGGGGFGVAPTAEYPKKNDVSTASSTTSCNKCHDPLGIHGSSRRDYKFCVVCHNAKTETAAGGGFDNTNLVRLVHKIHTSQDLGIFDASEVGYPQAPNNCLTCHSGPDADNTYDNWKTRPTIEACGACHEAAPHNVNFATGANHPGGVQTTNANCANVVCHPSTAIPGYHAAKEGAPPTPNNPVLAAGLKNVEYSITSATVDNTNAATVKFAIKIDNVVANLGDNVIAAPTGFSGGPSFLFAYALPQDGVSAPADYNNLGRSAGQPLSSSIIGKTIVAKDNTSYTVKVASAFPAGAKMRAVALQGYFTQTNAIGTDNVARHTPSVMVKVGSDTARRAVVKSGYTAAGKPEGCLECHEVFEGHGGNRVNNVQVCVMCHNPSLTTSGRTIDPASATPINPDIVALFGTDPLDYPEDANNFKELIHGLHANEMRVNEFVDIRNRTTGGAQGVLLLGEEVTYPGDLSHCTKCHFGSPAPAGAVANSYQNVQVPNALVTTTKITTGNASETLAEINAARASVPNTTDLVNTPGASACGYCHDAPTYVSHFILQGGKVKTERGTATLPLPELAPVNP